MSTLAVSPPSFEMATTETLPLAFDTTNLLENGESPTNASAVLTDQADGTVVALGVSPSIVSNTIRQTVTGSLLTARHAYWLRVSFTAAVGKVWTIELDLRCVA